MTHVQFFTLIGTLNIIIAVMGVGQNSKFIATFFTISSALYAGMVVAAYAWGPA